MRVSGSKPVSVLKPKTASLLVGLPVLDADRVLGLERAEARAGNGAQPERVDALLHLGFECPDAFGDLAGAVAREAVAWSAFSARLQLAFGLPGARRPGRRAGRSR
jgi:hypothetical protein